MNRLPNCVPSDTPHARHMRDARCECGALGRWEFGGFSCSADDHDERMCEIERERCEDLGQCFKCHEDLENCDCGKGKA